MATKKPIILLLLKILETKTDKNHAMTQGQIADEISQIYPCDRKTVCRNIQFLIEIVGGAGIYKEKVCRVRTRINE